MAKQNSESPDWYDELPEVQRSAGVPLADELNAGIIASEIERRLPSDETRLYTREEILSAANWSARAAISWADGGVMDWSLRLRSAGAIADGADTWLPSKDYRPKPLFETEITGGAEALNG